MFFKHLARLLALTSVTVLGEVIELTADNPPSKALSGFEFSVLSFVDNSAASRDSTEVFKEAEKLFSETSNRSNKIVWG